MSDEAKQKAGEAEAIPQDEDQPVAVAEPVEQPEEGGETDGQVEEATSAPTSPLSEAIQRLQSEKKQTWDRLLRNAAEFENFKKRSKRDAADRAQRAEDRVVLEFIPVIDNLERALAHVAEGEDSPPSELSLVDGVKMVHKQFLNTLEKFDIRPFDSLDEAFDPEFHEAIQQMADDRPAGTVVSELQRGYRRGDRLVRPALVVVSSGPAEEPAPDPQEASEEEGASSNPTEEQ